MPLIYIIYIYIPIHPLTSKAAVPPIAQKGSPEPDPPVAMHDEQAPPVYLVGLKGPKK